MPNHLLEIDDLSASEIAEIIRLSNVENPPQVLRNKGAALLFEKPSNLSLIHISEPTRPY